MTKRTQCPTDQQCQRCNEGIPGDWRLLEKISKERYYKRTYSDYIKFTAQRNGVSVWEKCGQQQHFRQLSEHVQTTGLNAFPEGSILGSADWERIDFIFRALTGANLIYNYMLLFFI